ncbi:MAG: GNAT family N-acetyltransferase [Candidatus Cloacimonetes bacterium]|nr:GNAT family N-acetyltransferase [Candidatus Cloacimonadota bacterium]
MNYRIVSIDESNLTEHPQFVCFINPKHPTYHLKVDWMRKQLNQGLRIKLIYPENEKKPQGFIEYIPGEYTWRGVSAAGYMFIHCLWVSSSAWKGKGLGSILIQDCYMDAMQNGRNGVAVLTSSDAFLAKAEIFTKNGFSIVDQAKPSFCLLTKQIKPGIVPQINNNSDKLSNYKGLHLIYAAQCPWVARFVAELDEIVKAKGLQITVTELKTPQEAQQALSPYGTFNLINNGKLLADHYISQTRFFNILKKEKLI